MKLRVDGVVYSGRAIDLSAEPVGAEAVCRAVSGDDSEISLSCPDPQPVYDHVGYIHPDLSLSRRSALAAAARSCGYTAPQDEALSEIRANLEAHDSPAVSVRAARKRAAKAGAECERLQESVAAQRGRVQALRALGEDPNDAETRLKETIAALSEQETERIAAEQTLAHAEQQARAARDSRERRMRLEDREANLRRAARRALAAQVEGEVEKARAQLPAAHPQAVASALAIARVASVQAPVVLSGEWFETATAAANWLCAPVIRL
ncbi:hypothetical protein [Haladaptatus sp. DJG-WS-42]|uniref:DUF7856 family protein n=1 Tax=Haladaptatus sp. DJG-WS-42 TaxID=3120516 RepID=UPI0030D25F40